MAAASKKKKATRSKGKSNEQNRRASRVHGDDPVHETPDQAAMAAHGFDREDEVGSWQRPHDLDAPPARPGYVQRWVRTNLADRSDGKNVARKMREGWRPRSADSIPEGFAPPTILHGTFKGCIGVEDLVLMEMPEHIAAQRDSHYRNKLRSQTMAIDKELHGTEDPSATGFGPIEKRSRSESTVGSPRNVPYGEDDN